MAADIATVEPTSIYAGDFVSWSKSLSDFPATAYSLSYRFIARQGASGITIIAAPDGSDFIVTLHSATTALWAAGEYTVFGYVSDGTDRTQVYSGKLLIKPDPATVTAFDSRTYLERVLAKLQQIFEEGVIREVVRYSYGGVATEVQTMKDVMDAIDRIKAALAQETAFATSKQRRILTRFTGPR